MCFLSVHFFPNCVKRLISSSQFSHNVYRRYKLDVLTWQLKTLLLEQGRKESRASFSYNRVPKVLKYWLSGGWSGAGVGDGMLSCDGNSLTWNEKFDFKVCKFQCSKIVNILNWKNFNPKVTNIKMFKVPNLQKFKITNTKYEISRCVGKCNFKQIPTQQI